MQLDELRHDDVPDMNKVGRLLVELAADEEYLAPLIAAIPAESSGVRCSPSVLMLRCSVVAEDPLSKGMP